MKKEQYDLIVRGFNLTGHETHYESIGKRMSSITHYEIELHFYGWMIVGTLGNSKITMFSNLSKCQAENILNMLTITEILFV